eukprot:TRINITY_DN4160_c0_g4_i2.p1 TRINITY_DN4160_c0_g4~~TRINITY_DN4160_c0_g4_i2.p1  ORF type:complete len:305 (-),score=94.42 TRINITY_DN4160_c0_g4_i2:165-1079(-)
MSNIKCIGITKNRTFALKEYKTIIIDRGNRFASKEDKYFLLEGENNNNSKKERLLDNHPAQSIEMIPGSLPPELSDVMEVYDATLELFKQIEAHAKEFGRLKELRVKAAFGNINDLESRIEDVSRKATSKLEEAQANVNKIGRSGDADPMKRNLQKALAVRIQEYAKNFRSQERSLYDFMMKFGGTPKEKSTSTTSFEEVAEDMTIIEEDDAQRDEAIHEIVNSMNKLANLFKQLNDVVIEQGTLLDRIDYHVEQSLQNTKAANKELKKTIELQKSGVATKCTYILIGMIIFLLAVLLLKHASR